MAIHQQCPVLSNQQPNLVIGISLIAFRCKARPCRGDGQTKGSLYYYCAGCSKHYNVCEQCGQSFSKDRPAQIS